MMRLSDPYQCYGIVKRVLISAGMKSSEEISSHAGHVEWEELKKIVLGYWSHRHATC